MGYRGVGATNHYPIINYIVIRRQCNWANLSTLATKHLNRRAQRVPNLGLNIAAVEGLIDANYKPAHALLESCKEIRHRGGEGRWVTRILASQSVIHRCRISDTPRHRADMIKCFG